MNVNLRDFPDDIHKILKMAAIGAGISFHQFIIALLAKEAINLEKKKGGTKG
jgi:predicted HicB family RNase H-like nuclease